MTTQTTVRTNGKVFTAIKKIGDRAVSFEVANKGICVLGFAKDRNAFMEAFKGTLKEVTKTDVIKRLSIYQGSDASRLVKVIKELKPVTLAAGHCEECNSDLSVAVRNYSMQKFGKALCRNHQPKGERSAPKTQQPKTPSSTIQYVEVEYNCDRCSGRGDISVFRHVQGGVCFKCKGTKKYTRKEKQLIGTIANPGEDTDGDDVTFNIGPSASEAPNATIPMHGFTYVEHGDCFVCDDQEVALYASYELNHDVCLDCCLGAKERYALQNVTPKLSLHDEYIPLRGPELATWWSNDNKRYGSCYPALKCDCGGTIRWVPDAGHFGCESCYTFMTIEAFTQMNHDYMDAKYAEELAAKPAPMQAKRATCTSCGKRRKLSEGSCNECTKLHNVTVTGNQVAERLAHDNASQRQPQVQTVTADDVDALLNKDA